ncbi:SDR family NAD(P)-dependent oxidoreductase [Nocardia sp. NPDC050712]|uniref:SDR family NAD(P)-dependent oxidoreductase n=1 Tax=Nocardia sp. NPDC050712 TaxID=3155518 RepID=UPI0033D5AE3B
MRTVVVTGGTEGMGAALVRHFLRGGDRVVVVARDRAKFDRLLAGLTAAGGSAGDRAEFVRADLSLVADSRRVVAEITARHPRIDALVLAASFVRQRRHVTAEGREASWVLFFVSKYLLTTGLADALAASDRPVIVNMSVPGTKVDAIAFDDLESARGFRFSRANAQQRRANELLGLELTTNTALSYLTWGPKRMVKTSFAGEYGAALRLSAKLLARTAESPDTAVESIIELLAAPPAGRHAYRGNKPVPLVHGPDDARAAQRLRAAVDHPPTASA